MNLNALHRRLLQDVLEIGNAFPFVITGGYAVQAHGLVDRLSRDIDVATNSSLPMASLADRLTPDSRNGDGRYDVIGTKVRALADRGYPRDLVDIHAASRIRSPGELEAFGRRCAWDEFSLEGLAIRLSSAQWRADEEFSAYGLSEDEIEHLRRWAQAWADDINRRLYAETYVDDEDEEIP
jgi:hypothetical protein